MTTIREEIYEEISRLYRFKSPPTIYEAIEFTLKYVTKKLDEKIKYLKESNGLFADDPTVALRTLHNFKEELEK